MRARLVAVATAALLAAALLSLAPVTAGAAAPQTSLGELESEVMCPVCGTLLELAEAPQAQRQKVFIKQLVASGASKEQIKAALVAEYGQEVLALPEREGFSLSAYLVPIVGFALAVIALALGVWKWRRASEPPDAGGPGAGPSSADSERLDADLARYDL